MADKSEVASFLRRQGAVLSGLGDVRAAFPGTPDRTLRRWLAELVKEGIARRGGSRKGARYRWAGEDGDEDSAAAPVSSLMFTAGSQMHLRRVNAPLHTRSPVTYAEEWVRSYEPNRTFYLSEAQREQLRLRGRRPAILGQAGTYIRKIYNRLLIDLSYNSSRLEGNTYSIADTERLIVSGIGVAGKPKEEQVMILNHKEAIRYLAQDPSRIALDEQTLRTLHYLLADGLVAAELAGHLRDEGVLVTGTTYVPLEGRERLARLLQSLLDTARKIEDPFEQSFFLLGHVSYLQAFIDVNKRLARLACIIPLIRNDYVPQSFVDAGKEDYTRSLICFYEFNQPGPLADLYCWSYLRSCEHFDTAIQVFGFDEVAVLYRPQRRALVADIVKSLVPLAAVEAYLETHMPRAVADAHRHKFFQDVMADLTHLDRARIAGMGIDDRQLQAWLDQRMSVRTG